GFHTGLINPGAVDPMTCARVGVECGCIEADPIDAGFIGRFSDLTVVDQVAWASAYSETYGDLVVGRFDQVAGWVWEWVDGVPADGEIIGAPSGPRGGTEDDGPDVGQYTAIAAGPDGALHVAYYDVDHHALKYAHGEPRPGGSGHVWMTMTVDAEGDAGRWSSISVGPDGAPGIAYRVANVNDESQIRYVQANDAAPNAIGDWAVPLVLQARALPDPDPETGSYPEGTGLFTSQARDPDGRPVVAWYDRTEGRLWWSRLLDAGFSEPEMLAGWGSDVETRDGDMGANVDLIIDAAGNAHLCFQDGMTDSLRYLAPELGYDEWVDDGVWIDTGGRGYAVHIVGDDCNIRLDADGNAVIVFQDATLQALLMRRRNREVANPEESPWSGRDVLRGATNNYQGAFGFYASAEVVDGAIWVVHYVYNNQVRPATRTLEFFSEDL
ncbi:MAG: hypothetical protein KC620_13220, partial [Myxococcales bacterium]|nr:hypothetical protein [Myxococcales bacterium]